MFFAFINNYKQSSQSSGSIYSLSAFRIRYSVKLKNQPISDVNIGRSLMKNIFSGSDSITINPM